MAKVYSCSTCGSSALDISALVGGAAVCRVCGWSGRREEANSFDITEDTVGGMEGMYISMTSEFRVIFRSIVEPIVKWLAKWGFIVVGPDGKVANPKEALQYVSGICRACVQSVLETREKIEKERHRG